MLNKITIKEPIIDFNEKFNTNEYNKKYLAIYILNGGILAIVNKNNPKIIPIFELPEFIIEVN